MRKTGSHRPVAQWTASNYQGRVTSAFCPRLHLGPGLRHCGSLPNRPPGVSILMVVVPYAESGHHLVSSASWETLWRQVPVTGGHSPAPPTQGPRVWGVLASMTCFSFRQHGHQAPAHRQSGPIMGPHRSLCHSLWSQGLRWLMDGF